jgi:putative phosphoribosyl transferase
MNVTDEWSVSLSIAETDGQTRAEARLVTSGGDQLAGHGQARRNPADREMARIGAQLAAARAFADRADFSQATDDEVFACLQRVAAPASRPPAAADPPARDGELPGARGKDVAPMAGEVRLAGYLTVPENAAGIVVFAHGSGSSRHSPRNRHVARVLNQAGLGTLLFDLLTPEEELDRANVFDIDLLARRLTEVTRWLRTQPRAVRAAVGYFGASTGAAAALWAAAEPGTGIAAVVSRGGRPDLARPRLGAVTAPTLLIVGGNDDVVLDLNRRAQTELHCENHLAVVPGATHLFEEPGTLDAAAALARDWFISRLSYRHNPVA